MLNRTISPRDAMYVHGQEDHYFRSGESALECIRAAMSSAGLTAPARILDFGSGHGRVLRHLRACFEESRITVCDLDADAVDFCALTFDAEKCYSDKDLRRLRLDGRFDLIWSGSVLTHIDACHWRAFLELCHRHLSGDGIVVFSTAGRFVCTNIKDYGYTYGLSPADAAGLVSRFLESGFAYRDYPGQAGYGLALASPRWVMSLVEQQQDLCVRMLSEACWDQHQDVYACVRFRDPVAETLKDYATALRSDLGTSGSRHDESPERLARWIDRRIARQGAAFGPRVRDILARRLPRLVEAAGSEQGPTEGQD